MNLNMSEFEERKSNLYKYFTNSEKWKENEYGEFSYYKGKRNLKELKFVLELVFGSNMDVISEGYFRNNEDEIIGGSITCRMYVDADFNGAYQGTKGADVFIVFHLTETNYFTNQSSSLEGL